MRIPSTQALRALDAFARLGSVQRAADELNLTRSAVSHQLSGLADDLGFALIERAGKGARLTARGLAYAADVRLALGLLEDAGARQREIRLGGRLTISCTAGFGSLWLCPRIGDFRARHPDVALTVLTPRRLDGVEETEADVWIAFGTGPWPERRSKVIGTVDLTPVCSPAHLNRVGGFSEPGELLSQPLLHLVDWDDWRRWTDAARIKAARVERGVIFSDLNLVLAAAAAGQGIAIGDELTCSRAFAEGRLVRPFDITVRSMRAYHLIVAPERADDPLVAAFTDWLEEGLSAYGLPSK